MSDISELLTFKVLYVFLGVTCSACASSGNLLSVLVCKKVICTPYRQLNSLPMQFWHFGFCSSPTQISKNHYSCNSSWRDDGINEYSELIPYLHFLRRFRHVKQPCLVRCRTMVSAEEFTLAAAADMAAAVTFGDSGTKSRVTSRHCNCIHFALWSAISYDCNS